MRGFSCDRDRASGNRCPGNNVPAFQHVGASGAGPGPNAIRPYITRDVQEGFYVVQFYFVQLCRRRSRARMD